MLNFKVHGTGVYLPEKREGRKDFLKKGVSEETLEEWGVFEHRVMSADETGADMEAKAAIIAFKQAGVIPEEIDLIICGAAVPQIHGVANSNILQHKIGAKNAVGLDVVLACAGAIPGLIVAVQFLALSQYETILVTASSNATRFTDYTDPSSFVVMGDGAGAAILKSTNEDRGLLAFDLQTKGEYFEYCGIKVKPPKYPSNDYNQEDLLFFIGDVEDPSSGITKYLLKSVPDSVNRALKKAGFGVQDVDMLICHQNIHPLSGRWVKMLGIPEEKTHFTYSKYGNMSSANIFVNLDEALRMNKIKKGDIVVFAGQGAGFSVGSIVVKW